MWLAGGGIKPGVIYGATDEYGYYAIENRVHVHDLHATVLHLLGFVLTRLTDCCSGGVVRLTDVPGHVVQPILA
jgi:hypothetical protein